MRRTLPALLTIVAAIGSARAGSEPAPGLGGLLVAPTRVVFEGRQRAAELALVNRGQAPATYRISLLPMRMSEDGAIVPVEGEATPTEELARGLVRFSPRQVTLVPGEPQTVRLQLRKPAELPAGEYRIHMLFRAVPDVDEAADPAPGLSIRLIPIYGVSIPLIVRHGETWARVAIGPLAYHDGEGGPRLSFTLERDGNRSVHGDLLATLVPLSGDPVVLGRARGLAVYAPNATRRVELPLRGPAGLGPGSGQIRLSYVDPTTAGEPLASAVWQLP